MPGRNFRKFPKFLGGVCTHGVWSGEKPRSRSLRTAGQRGLMLLNTQSIACQIIPLKSCVLQLVARDGMEKPLWLARSGSLYGWISLDMSSHGMLWNMMTCYVFMLCGSLIW